MLFVVSLVRARDNFERVITRKIIWNLIKSWRHIVTRAQFVFSKIITDKGTRGTSTSCMYMYSLYSSTRYSVHCALYTVHCTLYTTRTSTCTSIWRIRSFNRQSRFIYSYLRSVESFERESILCVYTLYDTNKVKNVGRI